MRSLDPKGLLKVDERKTLQRQQKLTWYEARLLAERKERCRKKYEKGIKRMYVTKRLPSDLSEDFMKKIALCTSSM